MDVISVAVEYSPEMIVFIFATFIENLILE